MSCYLKKVENKNIVEPANKARQVSKHTLKNRKVSLIPLSNLSTNLGIGSGLTTDIINFGSDINK